MADPRSREAISSSQFIYGHVRWTIKANEGLLVVKKNIKNILFYIDLVICTKWLKFRRNYCLFILYTCKGTFVLSLGSDISLKYRDRVWLEGHENMETREQ